MTTTSLEMSRKLVAAGFWKGRAPLMAWSPSGHLGASGHPADTFAATLDDLVSALGLDKPWARRPNAAEILAATDDHGLTPDVLAQVWLDSQANRLNTKGASDGNV